MYVPYSPTSESYLCSAQQNIFVYQSHTYGGMTGHRPPNVPVDAVEKTLKLLAALQAHGEAGVTELATEIGISKSTVHNHLRTLAERGYVVGENGSYRLGFRFLDHGGYVRERYEGIRSLRSKTKELARQTGDLCQFVVVEHGHAIVVLRERGEQGVETNIRVGTRLPVDQMIGGQVILATIPPNEAATVVERGETELPDTVEKIRTNLSEQGYTAGEETYLRGLRTVAAPLHNAEGTLLGALSVSGPSHRLSEPNYETDLADRILGVANEIELEVSYNRF